MLSAHFYALFRFAPEFEDFVLKEYANQSDYLNILAAMIRYYDTYRRTTATTQCLMLAYGAAAYILTCHLSTRLNGREGDHTHYLTKAGYVNSI